MQIKVKCPAKINLDLKVFPLDKKTGFHPIKSIMQTIDLFDYLTISISDGDEILLSGDSNEIPYDEKNICYKATKLFLDEIRKKYKIKIHIQKNIPVCAGLAGGSTDAVGVLFGLNKLLNNPLDKIELHKLACKLGSDLNFCLEGGKKLCTNRGEKLENLAFKEFNLTLIKPKNLKISAREAYCAFDELKIPSNLPNDLEFALLDKYSELKYLNSLGLQMSGSGPTFFKIGEFDLNLEEEKYLIIKNLKAINHGVILH